MFFARLLDLGDFLSLDFFRSQRGILERLACAFRLGLEFLGSLEVIVRILKDSLADVQLYFHRNLFLILSEFLDSPAAEVEND